MSNHNNKHWKSKDSAVEIMKPLYVLVCLQNGNNTTFPRVESLGEAGKFNAQDIIHIKIYGRPRGEENGEMLVRGYFQF